MGGTPGPSKWMAVGMLFVLAFWRVDGLGDLVCTERYVSGKRADRERQRSRRMSPHKTEGIGDGACNRRGGGRVMGAACRKGYGVAERGIDALKYESILWSYDFAILQLSVRRLIYVFYESVNGPAFATAKVRTCQAINVMASASALTASELLIGVERLYAVFRDRDKNIFLPSRDHDELAASRTSSCSRILAEQRQTSF